MKRRNARQLPFPSLFAVPAALAVALPLGLSRMGPDAPAKQGESRPLLECVPAGAFAFASVKDLAGLRSDMTENAWARMFRDDELQPLLDWCWNQLVEEIDDEEFAPAAEHLLDSLRGELVFFGFDAPRPEASGGYALLYDPGEGRASFEELLELMYDEDRENVRFEDYGGVSLDVWDLPGANPAGSEPTRVRAQFEREGRWAFFEADADDALSQAHAVIDLMGGSDEPGVVSSPLLAAARGDRPVPRLELFVDMHAFVRMGTDLLDVDEQKREFVLETLGLGDITWAHAAAEAGEGEELELHLRMSTPRDGYLRDWLGALGPAPLHLAGLGPADAVQAAFYNVDVFALWESGWDLFNEIAPEAYEQARAQFEAGLQSLGGLDLEGDFLAQLSGEMANFSLRLPEGEQLPMREVLESDLDLQDVELPEELRLGEVWIVGLEGVGTVELFLEELLDSVGAMVGLSSASVDTEDYRGHAVQRLELPNEMGFEWTFVDELWIGSLSPSSLRAALALHGAPDAPTIASDERLAPHLERHGVASVLGLAPSATYVRLGFAVLGMMADKGPAAFADDSEAFWDNVESQDEIAWPFDELPVPDGRLAERYLEGTLIVALEYSRERNELSLGLLSR